MRNNRIRYQTSFFVSPLIPFFCVFPPPSLVPNELSHLLYCCSSFSFFLSSQRRRRLLIYTCWFLAGSLFCLYLFFLLLLFFFCEPFFLYLMPSFPPQFFHLGSLSPFITFFVFLVVWNPRVAAVNFPSPHPIKPSGIPTLFFLALPFSPFYRLNLPPTARLPIFLFPFGLAGNLSRRTPCRSALRQFHKFVGVFSFFPP